MIDTHCHLTDPRLASQLVDVLDRAAAAGVTKMVTIGTDLADAHAAVAVSRLHAGRVRCAVGVHPNHAAMAANGDLEALALLAADPLTVAIGETGLDYHYDTPRDQQRSCFVAQLNLARTLGKPAVIHSRNAIDDTLAVMADFANVPAVFHCFTGSVAEVERVLARGCFVGFTGPITFKKNDELRRAVAAVPLDRLLLETDAPYLSPEPVRKEKTCEPAFVTHTARMAAAVKGITYEDLDAATTTNALRFYQWQ